MDQTTKFLGGIDEAVTKLRHNTGIPVVIITITSTVISIITMGGSLALARIFISISIDHNLPLPTDRPTPPAQGAAPLPGVIGEWR